MQIFLESETFSADKKSITVKPILGSEATPLLNQLFPPMPDANKDLDTKRTSLMQLESQIKSLLKTLETLNTQRKDLSNAMNDMGDGFISLGTSNITTAVVSKKATKIGQIHKQITKLHEKHVF